MPKKKEVLVKWAHQWRNCVESMKRTSDVEKHYFDVILFETEEDARKYRPDLVPKHLRITIEEL